MSCMAGVGMLRQTVPLRASRLDCLDAACSGLPNASILTEGTLKHYAPRNVQSDAEVLRSVLTSKETAVAEKPAGWPYPLVPTFPWVRPGQQKEPPDGSPCGSKYTQKDSNLQPSVP
jgi:hypothetical protein